MSNIDADLVLHLTLDEIRDGKFLDARDRGRYGDIKGNVTLVTDKVFGACASFDGAMTSYIEVPDSADLQIKGDLTVGAWIYISKEQKDGVRLLGKGAKNKRNYGLWYKNDAWLFQRNQNCQKNTALLLNTWLHLTGVLQGKTASLYLHDHQGSCIFKHEETWSTPPPTSADPLTIGYAGYDSSHNGKIANVRVHKRALSQAEIERDIRVDCMSLVAFRKSHPIDFRLYDDDEQAVLYITDDLDGHNLNLELRNTSTQEIQLSNGQNAAASEANHHFALQFRPGTLSDSAIKLLTNQQERAKILKQADQWDLYFQSKPPAANETASLYLLYKDPSKSFPSNESRRLTLQRMSTAHLVSVEGRYNAKGFDYQGAGENDLIRLVSLQSWSFACINPQQSFKELLTQLNREPSVLRLPNIGVAAANEYLALGSLPLWHGLRQGRRTVSWYHGPLAPAENTLTKNDHLPARAADELIRYSPATGMFDVSYASAWELGRLLALQSKTFSVGLYNWKRAHAQQLRQIEEGLLHDSPLDGGSGQEPIKIPPDIAGWFKRLSLLEGVPFNYLVPDERLLPPESIRFFQLDWLWIECLLDGAFSIGRVTAADHRRDSEVKSTAANPHAKVSGALMRSEVVSGWPGLLVDGFNEDKKLNLKKKLNLLRMDRLSANILLCLFEGDVTSVDFHLRPETAHFGLDQQEGPSSDFYEKLCKNLRDQQGDVSGLPSQKIDKIPWRQPLLGTIDVSTLAKTIKANINGNGSSFTSAQFAFQMIESSEKVSFHLTA
jgi:hypothetical protein